MTTTIDSFINATGEPTIYNARQLNLYFKTIRLPSKYLQHPIIKFKSVKESSDTEALRVLRYLIRYQLTHIPFENLELHYSTRRHICIDPAHLFHKMVERKCGRGGHCLENTSLLITVLRSLGYDVTATGARVNSVIQPSSQRISYNEPNFPSWNHMVAIVTIGGKRYLVDVGFGNNSLTYPVPLEDGYTGYNARPSTTLQLHRDFIPDISRPAHSDLMWVYSVRFEGELNNAPWIPAYCFGEREFSAQEFEGISVQISKNPKSYFTKHVMCCKFLMDDGEIVGDISLFKNVVKEKKRNHVRILTEAKTEQQRLEALRQYLGVKLSVNEKRGIHGLPSELK